jgi:hypothetical protein
MMHSAILQPIVALAIWTFIVWVWMYAKRIPALQKSDINMNNWIGGMAKDLDGILPAKVQWIAHNYNHLHEAPTVFYTIALVLAITGAGEGLNAQIAWGYVALRICHSLVQILWNKVVVRFALFLLSSMALFALVVQAAKAVF